MARDRDDPATIVPLFVDEGGRPAEGDKVFSPRRGDLRHADGRSGGSPSTGAISVSSATSPGSQANRSSPTGRQPVAFDGDGKAGWADTTSRRTRSERPRQRAPAVRRQCQATAGRRWTSVVLQFDARYPRTSRTSPSGDHRPPGKGRSRRRVSTRVAPRERGWIGGFSNSTRPRGLGQHRTRQAM
jgi:hypothetical protein